MGGLVSSITGGLFGGGGGSSGGGGQASSSSAGYYGPGTAQIYQPTGQYQADQSYQNLVNNLGSYGNNIGISQYLPQVEGATSNYVNNPNYVNNQMAADTAGKSAGYAGGQDIFTSEGLTNQIQGLQNESAQIGQQAFDPQNALYNQQVQQLQDQINAQNSMYGLGNSPVGASIAGNDLANFNLNWQNNLLNRETQGASAQDQLQATAAGLGTTSNNLASAGVGLQALGGSLPYSTYGQNQQNVLNAYGNLQNYNNSGYTLPQMAIGDYGQYLGIGANANNAANSASQQGFNNSGTLGSGIGSLFGLGGGGNSGGSGVFGGLGSLFSGGGGLDAGDTQFLADAGAGASGASTGGGFLSLLGLA